MRIRPIRAGDQYRGCLGYMLVVMRVMLVVLVVLVVVLMVMVLVLLRHVG